MRQGQQRRMRGRGRKGPNPLTRSYESNGPDVKIRGTALQIAEKYSQLARDAQSSGDRIQGESLLQHAEHYYRILAAAQAQAPSPQQPDRQANGEDEEGRGNGQNGHGPDRAPNNQPAPAEPAFGLSDPQPFVNGNGQEAAPPAGETPAEKPAETPVEQPAETLAEQPAAAPAEQPVETRAEKPEGRARARRRRPYRPRSAEPNAPAAEAPAAEAAPAVQPDAEAKPSAEAVSSDD